MPSLWEDLKWRGLVHQATDDKTLAERLDHGRITAYIGFDPTAGSLHVGHLQQLITLRRLREAGHRVIGLIGGGTGMIGDPSERSEERNLLSAEQLAENTQGIRTQVTRLLGEGAAPPDPRGAAPPDPSGAAPPDPSGRDQPADNPAIIADNSEWLAPARLLEFLRDVGKHFSVNEMIRKDSVRQRLEGREQGLTFTEFSYMLLQSWDFVQLFDRYGCELQLGGSDQWGNIAEGVDLIRRLRGKPAFGLTSPLVTKADGTKFGKTASGAVWLDPWRTPPYSFHQFWLRTPDADVGAYLRRFTFLERDRIDELERSLAAAPQRREAHRALAAEMTALVHGPTELARAEAAAGALFSPRIADLDEATLAGALQDAPSAPLAAARLAGGLSIVAALVESGLARSNREARQFLADGAVALNGTLCGEERTLTADDALHGRWVVLRRGKRHQAVLVVEPAPR